MPSRKVTIVVEVLITSCHVSLKPKMGPDSAQPAIKIRASRNTCQEPTTSVILCAAFRANSSIVPPPKLAVRGHGPRSS